jgi:DinB superfamily
MKNGSIKLSLSEFLAKAEAISKNAKDIFGQLNVAQINWKPNAESWSVGQCFDHLITANRSYFPQIDQIIRGEKKATLWQSMPFLPRFWGRMLINALSPNSTRRVKAPQSFQPSSSKIDPQIIAGFAAHQNELIDKMKATQGMDLEKVIIYSPALKLVTYSLFDAYHMMVVHEQRHFIQAQRVMDAPGFPQ